MTAAALKLDASPIPAPAIDVFRERCRARAILARAGMFDLHDAVDGLQDAATRTGLVDEIGQDAVQRMMADALAIVPRANSEGLYENKNDVQTRRRATVSTLRAAEYLVRQNDPARLRAWLAKRTRAECAAILDHIERKKL